MINYLVKNGADIEITNQNNMTAENYNPLVYGFGINGIDYNKIESLLGSFYSKFHIACMLGDLETVRLELNYTPELINKTDNYGMTGFLWAIIYGNIEVVEFLTTRGVDIYQPSIYDIFIQDDNIMYYLTGALELYSNSSSLYYCYNNPRLSQYIVLLN